MKILEAGYDHIDFVQEKLLIGTKEGASMRVFALFACNVLFAAGGPFMALISIMMMSFFLSILIWDVHCMYYGKTRNPLVSKFFRNFHRIGKNDYIPSIESIQKYLKGIDKENQRRIAFHILALPDNLNEDILATFSAEIKNTIREKHKNTSNLKDLLGVVSWSEKIAKSYIEYTEEYVSPYTERKEAYKILGLAENATNQAIKNKWKQLAKENHPDLFPEKKEEFIKIREAYNILTKP